MAESIRVFNDRVSKIREPALLITEAKKITRKIDMFYGLPFVIGVPGSIFGAVSLLRSESNLSPELALIIFLVSLGITYIPYIDLFGGTRFLLRRDILAERAKRLNVNLPKGPTEKVVDIAANAIFRPDRGRRE